MANGIILSAGVRQNLLALQNTAALSALTQNRLATGKKVNSALDNPTSFFTSASLQNRAGDLNSLLDSIGQAIQTLNATDQGLTSLTTLVQSAKSIATQALGATKGTVNYTNITGSVAIVADTTKITSTAVAATGTASTQATTNINAAGLGQLVNGDILTFQLGSGAVVTATKGAALDATTNTFNTAANLITVLNTGTGASGNVSAYATAATDGAAGVTVTSKDVTQDWTTGFTSAGLTAGNFSKIAHTIGDTLTLSDGTYSNTFYRVAAGALAANGTYTSAADLAAAIQAGTVHTSGVITSVVNGTGVDITTPANGSITAGGAIGAALGFATTAYSNNFNTTLTSLAGDLTVAVGTNATHTITIGNGNGQVNTKTGLNAALAAFTDVTGSVNTAGNVNLAPTSSDTVTIGGASGILTGLGLSAGGVTPVATVVTAGTTRTSLQGDFNSLLTQIDQLAKDASYNGINLLYGDSLKVVFNGDGTSSLTITGVKFDSLGLGLASISGTGFQDNKVINDTLTSIATALTSLRTQSSKFGSTLTTVQTRQDFTKNLITTLQIGSDNLVLADTNEEGANLLALQTRQQLSTTALSLANQANQAVLRLFG